MLYAKEAVILTVLILFGAFLRLYTIAFQCFWLEEAYTFKVASMPLMQIIPYQLAHDWNPPLYFLVAHVFLAATNFSEVAIRYPSVMFGILMIPLMYWLGVEYKDKLTGYYGAGITAVLFCFVYYSDYGRAYTMSFCAFILVLIMYIRIKRGDLHTETFAVFGFLVALTAWIHLITIVPCGIMLIDLMFDYFRKGCLAAAISAALISPLVYSIPATISVSGNFGYADKWWEILLLIPFEFFNTLPFVFIALTLFGAYRDKSGLGTTLLVIGLLTVIADIIGSFFIAIFPRYLLTVCIIMVMISAATLAEITQWIGKNSTRGIIPVIFILVISLLFLAQNVDYIAHWTIQKYLC